MTFVSNVVEYNQATTNKKEKKETKMKPEKHKGIIQCFSTGKLFTTCSCLRTVRSTALNNSVF